jgi:hypothetical protein
MPRLTVLTGPKVKVIHQSILSILSEPITVYGFSINAHALEIQNECERALGATDYV